MTGVARSRGTFPSVAARVTVTVTPLFDPDKVDSNRPRGRLPDLTDQSVSVIPIFQYTTSVWMTLLTDATDEAGA